MSSDYIFKYLTLGDFSVGKTTLTLRFTGETIPKNSMSTIGIDFKTKIFTLSTGKTVKLLLYDTAGQERFRKIASNYYNGTDCVFLVFDITNYETFKILSFWMDELSERLNQNQTDLEIILIGNKSDLAESRKVTREDAEEVAEKMKMKYFEISAMKGDGLEELKNYCLQRIENVIAQREKNMEEETYDVDRVSKLVETPKKLPNQEKKNATCC